MITSMDFADYVIVTANQFNKPVSNLALHTIMYFLNVMSLLQTKQPLIGINETGLTFTTFNETNLNNHVKEFINQNSPSLLNFDQFELVIKSQQESQWQNKVQGENYPRNKELFRLLNKYAHSAIWDRPKPKWFKK